MNTIFAIWAVAFGLLAVLRPSFFYKSSKLNVQQIKRNKRIWRTCGSVIVVLGLAGLANELLHR
jgi:hypothetical protein